MQMPTFISQRVLGLSKKCEPSPLAHTPQARKVASQLLNRRLSLLHVAYAWVVS